jgi:NhaP-type Na+/H+ or K+/H+ antiporter
MRVETIGPSAAAFALCCVSGFADAQGFVHASRVWAADRFVWPELVRSAFGFATGIGAYWVSVRFMQRVGVTATEIQTVIWFAATIIGVAIASGRFGKWPLSDQLVGGAVIVGLAWLLVRSSHAQ